MIESVQMCTCRLLFKSLCLIAGAFLLMGVVGCAQNPVTGSSDFVLLSEDNELNIERTNQPKIIAEYGRYQDEAIQDYVQSIGARLAKFIQYKP